MTKYHYCLLLMGSLLLGSCQSVEQLSIDYMLPAEVSFPATLKRVAVVNNMPNVPDNKLIITEEEQKKSTRKRKIIFLELLQKGTEDFSVPFLLYIFV